jgi:nicotinamide mononucleotide transporter
MNWTMIVHYLFENWLEVAGFLTTVLGIWLTTRRTLLCWPVVLAADIFYLIVFYRAQLLSDALLQIFFLIFTLYGWWHWWRGVREDGEVRIVRLEFPAMMIAVVLGAAGSFVLGELAKRLHAALPFLDATLTSYSLVASWWQARKHTASWWLWIVVDLIYIGEYLYKDLRATALLYAILVGLAVLGLRNWRRAARGYQIAA